VRHEEDDYSNDGIGYSYFCRCWVVWTNKISGEDGPNGQIQTPYGASTLADDHVLGINGTEPPIREISHKERNTGPMG
jgi:hypothetical protein